MNSWHWEESNRFEWAKQRLGELLAGLADTGSELRVLELKTCTGEASITKRKGNKK